MTVYVKPGDFSYLPDSKCSLCRKFQATLKVGIDSPLYEGVYKCCQQGECINKAVCSMKNMAGELGLLNTSTDKEESEVKSNEVRIKSLKRFRPIPFSLDGYTESKLEGLQKDHLEQLCSERGIPMSGTKAKKIARLLEWKNNDCHWVEKRGRSSH